MHNELPNGDSEIRLLTTREAARVFPVRFEALHPETREVVWSGVMQRSVPPNFERLHIPPLRKLLGHPVLIRATFADGSVIEKGVDYDNND
jgi:hypothetical protein